MRNELWILLIEDDVENCNALKEYIEPLDDVKLIGISNNVEAALSLTKEYMPDAVLLDLELHQGSGTGLDYLANVKKLENFKYPFILIITNNTSEVTLSYARKLGADFIMTKYNSDYSAKSVVEFLRSMKNIIQTPNYDSATPPPSASTAHHETLILDRIHREFDLIGINTKVLGYDYLAEAVILYMQNPNVNLTKTIGERRGKSAPSIERAMQNAICYAWRHTSPEELEAHYKAFIRSDRGMPTLMEFISYYARKVHTDDVEAKLQRY